METFYTYCHIRKDSNKIFYIGKGKNFRAFCTVKRNAYWNNIASKYGFEPKILAYWNTEKEAFEHEKVLIACFKDMGYKLANMTDGGDGQTGLIHTQTTKQKISNALKGRKFTEEHKQKIAQSNKNKIVLPETGAKISKLKKGKKITEEHKLKISKSMRGRNHTEETKKKMSISAKKYAENKMKEKK